MNTCYRDMQGISFRIHWNAPLSNKADGKKFGLVGYCQFTNALQRVKSPLRGPAIA
ncbi:MAG: hypothetical protein ACOYOU_01485 [Kiritimatiellia bacterium]